MRAVVPLQVQLAPLPERPPHTPAACRSTGDNGGDVSCSLAIRADIVLGSGRSVCVVVATCAAHQIETTVRRLACDRDVALAVLAQARGRSITSLRGLTSVRSHGLPMCVSSLARSVQQRAALVCMVLCSRLRASPTRRNYQLRGEAKSSAHAADASGVDADPAALPRLASHAVSLVGRGSRHSHGVGTHGRHIASAQLARSLQGSRAGMAVRLASGLSLCFTLCASSGSMLIRRARDRDESSSAVFACVRYSVVTATSFLTLRAAHTHR